MRALKFTVLAFALVLTCVALAPRLAAAKHIPLHGVGGVSSEQDPTDCPFCAGNPAVHVRAMFAMEHAIQSLNVQIAH